MTGNGDIIVPQTPGPDLSGEISFMETDPGTDSFVSEDPFRGLLVSDGNRQTWKFDLLCPLVQLLNPDGWFGITPAIAHQIKGGIFVIKEILIILEESVTINLGP